MGEIYGDSIKQAQTREPIAVENWQEQIPFEAVPEDDLPVVDLFDLENEDALRKVEQIPAWKRRFLKK